MKEIMMTGELQDLGAAPHERREHPHEGQGPADPSPPHNEEQAHQVHGIPPQKVVPWICRRSRQQQCMMRLIISFSFVIHN